MNITLEGVTPGQNAAPVTMLISVDDIETAYRTLFTLRGKGAITTSTFTPKIDGNVLIGRIIASAILVGSSSRFLATVVNPPITLKSYVLLAELERTVAGEWSGELHVVTPAETNLVWASFRADCFVWSG